MYPQQPAPQARRRSSKRPNRTLLMVLVSVLGLLALCLVSVVAYGVTSSDKKDTQASTTTAAAATSSGLDDAARFACTDFAKGYKAAQTKQARIDLANKVNKWAATSKTSRISDMGAALGRGADSSADAWKLAGDAFAQACLDAGWSADTAG